MMEHGEREERTSTADPTSERDSAENTEERELDQDLRASVHDRDESEERTPLLGEDAATDVRSRWERIQASFVDEPRRAVEGADALVAELTQRLADSFAQERERLEGQWDQGDEVSTEELRIALQRYRSFFDRLLSA
jgi:hypothetical protein